MKSILGILLASIISSYMCGKKIYLPGKIAVTPHQGKICTIYNSDSKSEVQLRYDEQFRYSGLKWLHQDDSFVGVEGLKTKKRGTVKSNVVRFDLSGNIIDRIYESKEGEYVGSTYPSLNDTKLLFTSEKEGDSKSNPLEGLSRKQSIVIMDFKQKKVLKQIEDIGTSTSLQLEESPWLIDESRFIYSIIGDRKIFLEDQHINPVYETYGIYLYDLKTDELKLIVPNGSFGVCSPVKLEISYIKDKSVWILNLSDNTTRRIYKAGLNEKVADLHWTPDGKYIYLVYYKNAGSDWFRSTGEKLIDISNCKNVDFNKIGHGLWPNSYTWK